MARGAGPLGCSAECFGEVQLAAVDQQISGNRFMMCRYSEADGVFDVFRLRRLFYLKVRDFPLLAEDICAAMDSTRPAERKGESRFYSNIALQNVPAESLRDLPNAAVLRHEKRRRAVSTNRPEVAIHPDQCRSSGICKRNSLESIPATIFMELTRWSVAEGYSVCDRRSERVG